jgi:hypothetical protein
MRARCKILRVDALSRTSPSICTMRARVAMPAEIEARAFSRLIALSLLSRSPNT